MRHSIRRWTDWVMANLTHPARFRPTEQAVHLRYEKAGQLLHGPTVPWNADALVVELLAKLPPIARQRTDFVLRIPGREPIVAEAVRADDAEGVRHRVFFRVAVPPGTVTAELLWKHRLLAELPIVVLSADEFLANLQIANPTVTVRVGTQSVAAQTFVASQCRGVTAALVLRSPTGLAPLADVPVMVNFRCDRTNTTIGVPAVLTGAQLATKEVLLTVAPPKPPRLTGGYSVTWTIAGREAASHRLLAVTGRRFLDSVRVSDARFAVADKAGTVKLLRTPPALHEVTRLGPCFVLASREMGVAGVLPVQVVGVMSGAGRPPVIFEQTVLVTDGPSVFAPGLIDVNDLTGVTGFELRHKNRVLGLLSISPVPAAAFNAEGGFKPPPDFAWTTTAEDELTERLARLMGNAERPPTG